MDTTSKECLQRYRRKPGEFRYIYAETVTEPDIDPSVIWMWNPARGWGADHQGRHHATPDDLFAFLDRLQQEGVRPNFGFPETEGGTLLEYYPSREERRAFLQRLLTYSWNTLICSDFFNSRRTLYDWRTQSKAFFVLNECTSGSIQCVEIATDTSWQQPVRHLLRKFQDNPNIRQLRFACTSNYAADELLADFAPEFDAITQLNIRREAEDDDPYVLKGGDRRRKPTRHRRTGHRRRTRRVRRR